MFFFAFVVAFVGVHSAIAYFHVWRACCRSLSLLARFEISLVECVMVPLIIRRYVQRLFITAGTQENKYPFNQAMWTCSHPCVIHAVVLHDCCCTLEQEQRPLLEIGSTRGMVPREGDNRVITKLTKSFAHRWVTSTFLPR